MIRKTGTQTIGTRRLLLRRFRIEDAGDMYENWASDPEVTRFLTWQPHADVGVTRALLNEWIPCYKDGGYFNWVVEWKQSGRAIGNISCVKVDENGESCEIGYCLSRSFWGRGIMPEALRAVIRYLFDTAGFYRIAARHDAENLKSGRVMEKAGMLREGVARGSERNGRGFCDMVLYALLRSDTEPICSRDDLPVKVRMAQEEDLERVNGLRREVQSLHAEGEPGIFKPEFGKELRELVYGIMKDPDKGIVVAERDGRLCGFAVLNHVRKPETPFMFEREHLDIDEFGVDEDCRRQGVASAMIAFIRCLAGERGCKRIELNMWEFNRDALAFYEASGFSTYRRYMETEIY